MKKKYTENSDEDNEFDVDEPEEIQNNASDDDWTPDKDNTPGRRMSSRLRNIPKSRAPIIDASSTDDEGSDEGAAGGKRKSAGKARGRGRPPAKKHKVATPASTPKAKTPTVAADNKSVSSDSEPTSTTTGTTPTVIKLNKDFTSGAFVVLKTDAENYDVDPPLWKIDGKALLQKYVPFEQDGKTLYKNTSVYSGWTLNNKDNYHAVSVIFKQQTRKEHIVEFHRDQIKQNGESEEVTSSSTTTATVKKEKEDNDENSKADKDKPVIKVKSFASAPEDDNTLKTSDKVSSLLLNAPVQRINKDFANGAFLVLKTDAPNVDPPLWKIDGKSLLQKYNPFQQNGKTLYKNTAEYSGWSMDNKDTYYPTMVIFKQQNKKEHIVELDRIKWDEGEGEEDE